jgi:carbamate kinase
MPDEQRIGALPSFEARARLQRGEFAAGGAAAKVQAALDYLAGNANAGARAMIGSLDDLAGLVEGTQGTRLVP